MCRRRESESSRTRAMAARAWLPLSVLLLFQLAVTAQATAYNVGGIYTWGVFPSGFSFQTWSDEIVWYSGDVLSFIYDYSLHNVWAFQDQASFASCDFSGVNLLGIDYATTPTLLPGSPGSSTVVYLGSSRGLDCLAGMAFSVTYYTCPSSGCSSSSSPPAPTRTIPSPPNNVTDSGSSEKKKTTVPIAAIAVPIVLVLVLGAGTLVFCCVLKARRQAQAAATPPKFPPQSPLPTFDPIPVPNGAPGPGKPPPPEAAAAASGAYGYGASSADYFPNSSPKPGLWGPPSTSSTASSTGGKTRRKPSAGSYRTFTYQELRVATGDFSPDSQIGKGGFGVIYKGVLQDGTVVAIKGARHLDKAEDKQQLLNEVAVLSKLNHRNLVRLLGCCVEEEDLLLVYDFVPNGTVAEHLARSRQGYPTKLDWATRFKIAIQTAEALKYLHVQVTPPIFHRDVKSANILLDDGFNAKVADFGMSRLVEDLDATHVSTMVKGTTGYLDPEYFFNGQLTDKSDVYSLGMVLLELLAARKPVDVTQPQGEQNLASVAVPLIVSGRVLEILDPQLSTGLTSKEMLEAVQGVAQVAVACLVQDGASRPSMSQVVEMLQKIKGSNLKAEEFYGKPNAHAGSGGIMRFNIGRPAATGRSSEYSTSSLVSGSSWSSESGGAGSQSYYSRPR